VQDWGERDPRWAGIRTEWIEVSGTQVRTLRVDGPEHGVPQLLVHGLGGSSTNWLEVMVELSAYGPVLAMDLPGFGLTAPPSPNGARVRPNARFISALCRAVGWDRVVLYGNSMGGLIGTLVAGHRRDLVERLVLVNPGLPAPRRHAHRISPTALLRFAPFVSERVGRLAMERMYERLSPERVYRETVNLVYADPDNLREPLREVAVENVARARELDWRIDGFVQAATSLIRLFLGARTITRAIERIEAPTLVLWGDQDQLVGRPVIEGLTARRPDWDLHVFEDCGHVPQLEFPDDFVAVVERWLETSGIPRAAALAPEEAERLLAEA
jgi:pimeloyl-ACP methyl ester carboxylesterase